VRERIRDAGRGLRGGYGVALFAMEKYLRESNVEVSQKIHALRQDIERELGLFQRWPIG